MKSKLFGKKSIIVLAFSFAALVAVSFIINAFAVKPYITSETPIDSDEIVDNVSDSSETNRKKTDDGFFYAVFKDDSEEYVLITKYVGNETHLKVPSSINGLTVKGIDNTCFAHCDKLLSIELPEEVEMISDFVFAGCKSLEKVIIHSDDVEIGQYINTDTPKTFTFVAHKNSDAEKYATENNIKFEALKDN